MYIFLLKSKKNDFWNPPPKNASSQHFLQKTMGFKKTPKDIFIFIQVIEWKWPLFFFHFVFEYLKHSLQKNEAGAISETLCMWALKCMYNFNYLVRFNILYHCFLKEGIQKQARRENCSCWNNVVGSVLKMQSLDVSFEGYYTFVRYVDVALSEVKEHVQPYLKIRGGNFFFATTIIVIFYQFLPWPAP